MTRTILCIDIGTSSLKAALLSKNPKEQEVFVSRQAFPQEAFEYSSSAFFYISSLRAALEELCQKNPDYVIEAVCVSGNGPTVISDDYTTLLYSDLFVSPSRGRASVRIKEILKNTKSLFIPRFVAFKELFKDSWNQSAFIFGAPEFLIYKLTGKAFAILPEERFLPAYWTDEELVRSLFPPYDRKKIPPFIKSASLAGFVSPRIATETGLPENIPVYTGAPDFVVALIGSGTVVPGRLCDRAGSSEGLNLCTSKPVFAEGLRTLPSVVPGLWNLSYLLDAKAPSYEEEFAHGINLLRETALANSIPFPQTMTISGGQAFNENLIKQKEKISGLQIKKMLLEDAELLGDLILARLAAGEFENIQQAVSAVLGD